MSVPENYYKFDTAHDFAHAGSNRAVNPTLLGPGGVFGPGGLGKLLEDTKIGNMNNRLLKTVPNCNDADDLGILEKSVSYERRAFATLDQCQLEKSWSDARVVTWEQIIKREAVASDYYSEGNILIIVNGDDVNFSYPRAIKKQKGGAGGSVNIGSGTMKSKQSLRNICGHFVINYMYPGYSSSGGGGDESFGVTFDAAAAAVTQVFSGIGQCKANVTPQNIADSASTMIDPFKNFKMLGQNRTEFFFPVNSNPGGLWKYDSLFFAKNYFDIYIENTGFNTFSQNAFKILITNKNQQLIATIDYDAMQTLPMGPSAPYLSELINTILKSQNIQTQHFPDPLKASQVIALGATIKAVYNALISGAFGGISPDGAKKIVVQLLFDLKRTGDYEQVNAAINITNITGNKVILGTGDFLCSAYARRMGQPCILVGAGTGNKSIGGESTPQPGGSAVILFRTQPVPLSAEEEEKIAAARALLAQWNGYAKLAQSVFESKGMLAQNFITNAMAFNTLLEELGHVSGGLIFNPNNPTFTSGLTDKKNHITSFLTQQQQLQQQQQQQHNQIDVTYFILTNFVNSLLMIKMQNAQHTLATKIFYKGQQDGVVPIINNTFPGTNVETWVNNFEAKFISGFHLPAVPTGMIDQSVSDLVNYPFQLLSKEKKIQYTQVLDHIFKQPAEGVQNRSVWEMLVGIKDYIEANRLQKQLPFSKRLGKLFRKLEGTALFSTFRAAMLEPGEKPWLNMHNSNKVMNDILLIVDVNLKMFNKLLSRLMFFFIRMPLGQSHATLKKNIDKLLSSNSILSNFSNLYTDYDGYPNSQFRTKAKQLLLVMMNTLKTISENQTTNGYNFSTLFNTTYNSQYQSSFGAGQTPPISMVGGGGKLNFDKVNSIKPQSGGVSSQQEFIDGIYEKIQTYSNQIYGLMLEKVEKEAVKIKGGEALHAFYGILCNVEETNVRYWLGGTTTSSTISAVNSVVQVSKKYCAIKNPSRGVGEGDCLASIDESEVPAVIQTITLPSTDEYIDQMFSITQLITAAGDSMPGVINAVEGWMVEENHQDAGLSVCFKIISNLGQMIENMVGPNSTFRWTAETGQRQGRQLRTAFITAFFQAQRIVPKNFIFLIKKAKMAVAKKLGPVFVQCLSEKAKDVLPDMLDDFAMFMYQERPRRTGWAWNGDSTINVAVLMQVGGAESTTGDDALVNTISKILVDVNVGSFCIINNMINLKQFGYNPYTTLFDGEIMAYTSLAGTNVVVKMPTNQGEWYWKGSMEKGGRERRILGMLAQQQQQQADARFNQYTTSYGNTYNPMIMEVLLDFWKGTIPPLLGSGTEGWCIDNGNGSFLSIYQPIGRSQMGLIIPGPPGATAIAINFNAGHLANKLLKGGGKLRRKTRKRKNKKRKTKRKRKKMRKTKKKKRRKQKRSRHRKKRSK